MTSEQQDRPQDREMSQIAITIGLMLFFGAVSLAVSYIAVRTGLLNPSGFESAVAVTD